MNALRVPVRQVLRRSCLAPQLPSITTQRPRVTIQRPYVTAQRPFVPPSQLNNVRRGGARRRRRNDEEDDDTGDIGWAGDMDKEPPTSPSFYTGRPEYFDQVTLLQNAIVEARKGLKAVFLLPLPDFARKSLPAPFPIWKDQEEMSSDFQSQMSRSRYRRVVKLLNELNYYFSIAKAANASEVQSAIGSIVALFESGKKAASFATRKKKPVTLDHLGRSYSVGKRKTSSARVWMISVRPDPSQKITASTVLVNNIPLAEYFPIPADRERIMRPFKVAGVVGAYNVFAIVRGGGTTGQSGALSHGIAKGLVIHEASLQPILKKAQLTRRDPRMVERKKTGMAKARKRYTWVKR
ncbi:hypothetical protein H0H87_005186 [Tephrocybe sp. NHM501043]|nr:hypothetical protein H0H87_005186 [Tephrocybe sp. NHM501043]